MKNVVVYTAIFGNYDFLYEPTIVPDNVDFVCFTDNKNMESNVWQIRNVLPLYKNPELKNPYVRNARKYKALPHRFLSDYEYSIWVDGNATCRGNINELVNEYLDTCNIAVYDKMSCMLDPWDCIYEEARRIFQFGEINLQRESNKGIKAYKDNPKLIKKQVEKYKKEGFPEHLGLLSAMVIVRRHNKDDCIELGEGWWNEMKYYSHLDQMSFNYVTWKNKTKFNWIKEDVRNCRHFLNEGKHKVKIKITDDYEPINLEYFLNMKLQQGGGGKEVILNNKTLKTVREVVDFWKSKDVKTFQRQLNSSNWQYFNCMVAQFKHDVANHHDMGWNKLTKEYFDSLGDMTDDEIEVYLKENPVEFESGFIKHSYHRAVAMIGRLIFGKKYIPFYMDRGQIYDKSPVIDNVKYITIPETIGIPRGDFTVCQSGILSTMGIRQNDDLDIIISTEARNQIFKGDKYFIRRNGVEIFEKDKGKFIIFDAQGDDDLIENYSFQIDGYNFLEPRFYFSRKNKKTEKDLEDWKGIERFFELENYKGYPFNQLTLKQWGYNFI